jgi:hypothetical protein
MVVVVVIMAVVLTGLVRVVVVERVKIGDAHSDAHECEQEDETRSLITNDK